MLAPALRGETRHSRLDRIHVLRPARARCARHDLGEPRARIRDHRRARLGHQRLKPLRRARLGATNHRRLHPTTPGGPMSPRATIAASRLGRTRRVWPARPLHAPPQAHARSRPALLPSSHTAGAKPASPGTAGARSEQLLLLRFATAGSTGRRRPLPPSEPHWRLSRPASSRASCAKTPRKPCEAACRKSPAPTAAGATSA